MAKCIFIFLTLSLLSFTSSAQNRSFKDLTGNWEITGEEKGSSLFIRDSSTIILTYMGEKKVITDYKIDFSKSPIWFDFSTQDSTGTVNIKSLIEIESADIIKWQMFIDEERPPFFSSTKGEMFFLKKVKPASTTASN
jgi:hypothetical protein